MDYRSEVAWGSIIRNVVLISDFVYQLNLAADNPNELGATTEACEVGYYVKDFVGNTYRVTKINTRNPLQIEVTDFIAVNIGPQVDQMGYIYQSVDNGNGDLTAPVPYRRLDKSAKDISLPIESEVVWQKKINKEEAIAFAIAL